MWYPLASGKYATKEAFKHENLRTGQTVREIRVQHPLDTEGRFFTKCRLMSLARYLRKPHVCRRNLQPHSITIMYYADVVIWATGARPGRYRLFLRVL
jgi:hypothetical protein